MNNIIPKTIYMCYKTINYAVLKKKKEWQELNPEYKIIIYDDDKCRKFLKNEYSEIYLNLFDFLKDGPIKADFWRICILNKYGGIYADIDIKPIVPIRQYINENDEFVTFLSSGPNILLNPHFIKSPANNIILKHCIKFYLYQYNKINIKYNYWKYSIVTIMGIVIKNLNIIDLNYKKTTQRFTKKNINFMFLEEKTCNTCFYHNKLILLNRSKDYFNHSFNIPIYTIYNNIELYDNQYILPSITRHNIKKDVKLKNIYTTLIDLQLYKLNSNKRLKKDIILKKNTKIKKYKTNLINVIEII